MKIPDHYQVAYADKFEGLLQLKRSKFAQFATEKKNPTGKVCFLDQIDPIDLDEKTGRHEESQLHDPQTRRRAMRSKTFHKMVGFDEDDDFKLGLQNPPMIESAMQLMYGGQRTMERTLVAGLSGPNQVGDGPDDMLTVENFPTANEIAVTEGGGGGNTHLPIDKIAAGIEGLMTDEAFGQDTNDSDLETPCLAISPMGFRDLIRQNRATSRDFQEGGNLGIYRGAIEQMLGCKIMITNYLPKTGNIREALLWVKPALQYGLWKNYSSRLYIHEGSGGTRYRVHMAVGAARALPNGYRKLFCDETVKTAA